MKTLFIIYILLSVIIVLFCWVVNHDLKKQIASLNKLNKANVAEIKSRTDELNALTTALVKYKESNNRGTILLKDAEKALTDARQDAKDAENLANSYAKSNNYLTDIIEILVNRHGYNKLEGFGDTIEVDKMFEFIKNNDLSKNDDIGNILSELNNAHACIGQIKEDLAHTKEELVHTKENLDIMCQEFGQVQHIALTLIKRHNYNVLKGFDDNASWATLDKFIEEHDTRRRGRAKKSEDKD